MTLPLGDVLAALTKIEARCAHASDGPWEVGYGRGITGPRSSISVRLDGQPVMIVSAPHPTVPASQAIGFFGYAHGFPDSKRSCEADVNFVAASRADVPALVKLCRALLTSGIALTTEEWASVDAALIEFLEATRG
jgi:hypothetical protein